jgi:hypothetical protein
VFCRLFIFASLNNLVMVHISRICICVCVNMTHFYCCLGFFGVLCSCSTHIEEYRKNHGIRKARKGKFLDSLKKYHIFLASKQQTQMNEFNIDQGNLIFEVIHKTLTK